MFTNPLMYKQIKRQKTTLSLYTELLVKDAIADGRLEVLEGPEPGRRAYWLVAPLPQWRTRKVRNLVDFLKEE